MPAGSNGNSGRRLFTNSPNRQPVVLTQGTMRNPPHVAKGEYGNRIMPLTPREREARRITKMHRTAQFSVDPINSGNTAMSGAPNFFSPQLSTDFLELPQSLREKREIYRHFYNTDPLVGQAIDLHTELPLSKVRLAGPKPITCPKGFDSPESYGKYILWFFENWSKRAKLFQHLITAVHHYWLDGSIFIFLEDSTVDIPQDIGYEQRQLGTRSTVTDDGEAVEESEYGWAERPDREDQELAYYQKHYKGWDRIIMLPIDQVKVTTYSFTDKVRVELIPSDRDRALIEQAKIGNDPIAEEMANEIPEEVREYIASGRLIPLGTDPDEGSFCYHLSGRRGAGEEMGQSILDRCLRTLYYREKLRQAQTQIASRAMTPKRIVWAEDISEIDVDDLREQVDLALVDPDYSIVANYEVHWEEMGSNGRLLDLSTEYEITDKQLHAGLGVTESLLSGETLYSGDRLKLEVINTRYMFLREMLQEFVEEYIFKPVAKRKGFVEKNEWGEEVVLYPRLSFTRLPLRDSQDTFDALLNLYQKGSVSIDVILELFNLDADDMRSKLERDQFTVNDATFNEVLRSIYNGVGEKLIEATDVQDRVMKGLGLKAKPKQADSRFG
jgi:hypothetical protein